MRAAPENGMERGATMATRDELLASVDAAREEIIALCQALVRVPSVNTGVMPTGDETPAAEILRDKLAADGLDSDILESAPNRGNFVARLRGSAGSPRLLYLSHTDVVPVEDEAAWTHPPFGAEIHDGRIYGRGANDMKNTVAAEAMAMILLKRAGVPLRGDLIFAAGADEESGGEWGFAWLAKHHPEKLEADFGLNEGGGALVHAADGRLAYLVSPGEKGRLEIVITVKGRGWHASQPWRADNAIYKAQEVIRRIAGYEPERYVDPALIGPLADLYGITETITAENVDRIAAELEGRNPNWASSLKAMTRMTFVASMIHAGVKSNSVAESCEIKCDIRTLPHQDERYVRDQLTRLLAGLDGVSFVINYTAVPSASPYDRDDDGFAERVRAATRTALGRDDLAFVPSLTVGFTDSRLVRHLCPVVYGFLPSHPDADPSKGGAHNIDESADIESMILSTKMLVALAYDLLT
jgi:acetylornithine deacetylase/succinyl-diaminopimelate desuccinylase-like protein